MIFKLMIEPFDIVIYRSFYAGYGCYAEKLHVTPDNFVSQTDTSITVRESYVDQDGGDRECDQLCYTDIDVFVAAENKWFAEHIKEVTARHEITLKQAAEHKEKNAKT